MKIRAKVQVQEKTVHAGSEIPEALQFAEATPSGEIKLLMKKSVADQFEMGAYYNVDFEKIPQ